jgi:hypothetical protein
MRKLMGLLVAAIVMAIPSYGVIHPITPCCGDHREIVSVAGPSCHSYFFEDPGPEYFGMDTESNEYLAMLAIRDRYEGIFDTKNALIEGWMEDLNEDLMYETTCTSTVANIRAAFTDIEKAWIEAVYDILDLMPENVYKNYIDYLDSL